MTENPTWMRGFLAGCLNKAPATEIHRLADRRKNELLPEQDSELKYYQGAVLAACGEKQIAYDFCARRWRRIIARTRRLQSDPLLAACTGTRISGRLCRRRRNARRNLAVEAQRDSVNAHRAGG